LSTAPGTRSPWRARQLLASPHRLGFVAAAAVASALALGWAGWLHASPAAALPRPTAHALAFVFGFLPLFFAGFLFTIGPRWLGVPITDEVAPAMTRAIAPALLLYAAAWLAWWPVLALFHHRAGPALLLALAALAWSTLSLRLCRMPARGRRPSPHLRAAAAICVLGALLLWAAAAALAAAAWTLAHTLALVGLWGFVGAVFAVASHRMLPLDSMIDHPTLEQRHPLWLLALLLGVLALQALAVAAQSLWWPLPRWLDAGFALASAAAAAPLALIAWRWRRRQQLGRQLVAMLHIGFVWLVITLLLRAAEHGLAAAGLNWPLGPLAVHAAGLGWMGSTLFSMASRVAGAFSGQALAADRHAWTLFAAVQLAVLARLAASVWPASASIATALAALAWALACAGWLIVYGRWLGRMAPGHDTRRATQRDAQRGR
jgi:uncharacterized protein involved in response to NO